MDVWYEFVLAQMASDSYLDDEFEPFSFSDPAQLAARLRNGANHYNNIDELIEEEKPLSATRMTDLMVTDFGRIWEVIDHLPNTTSGFSATVLRHRTNAAYTLSLRSTESRDAIDGGDVERDSFNGANGQISFDGFAWGQLADLNAYYEQLKAGALATGSADAGAALAAALAAEPINVTGYSLGGHLAQVFTLMHPAAVAHTYTFNAAGFGTIDGLDPLTQYGPAILERINTLDAVMADPLAYLEHFNVDTLANLADDLKDGTARNLIAGPPFLQAMFKFVTDLRDTVFGAGPPQRIYDDPYFKLALSVLPADTAGASTVGLLEFVNYTREQLSANDKITNLYGHSFSGERVLDEFVAGAGQMTGDYVPVYIEDQPLLAADIDEYLPSLDAILRSFGPTHSIALVADSLAVMTLYAAVDPTLVVEDPATPQTMRLNRLFESLTNTRARLLASPKGEGNTLEVALDSLGHLVVGETWQPTAWNAAPGAYGNVPERNAFYDQIERLRNALFDNPTLKPAYAGLKILSLTDVDAATLAQRAESELAYRYALRQLNPFVVTGNESIYAQHEPSDDTDPGSSGGAQFSSGYWFDRANFLLGLMDANVHSRSTPDGTPTFLSATDIDYLDATNGKELHAVTPYRVTIQRAGEDLVLLDDPATIVTRVTFSNGATIEGSRGDDRLYGEHAANTLIGMRGGDRLEGGDGDDTLYANDESNVDDDAPDLLQGGRGTDIYYAGSRDIVEDSDGSGEVIFRDHLLGAAYREIADPADAYTSQDGRYTYWHDPTVRTLTVTDRHGDPGAALTIANFINGSLGITLHENPQPVDTRFFGSGADDIVTVSPAGTEIAGMIDGQTIDPLVTFTPRVELVAARGGDDLITVRGDLAAIRIHGDHIAGAATDDGHDEIAVDTQRVAAGEAAHETANGARVFGGGGNDLIQGGQRDDDLLGESGNDRIYGHHGDDRISGGEDDPDAVAPDNDVLLGGHGRDELFGRYGDDTLFGGQGADVLNGGDGNDAVYGDLITWGYDVADRAAWSGPSNSWNRFGVYTASAGAGATLVPPSLAGEHAVFVNAIGAAAGADVLDGGAGDDHLLGGDGADTLAGGTGRDLLEGEEGDDTLFGGDGNDFLYGDISPTTFANHRAVLRAGTASDGDWTLSFREFVHGPDAGGNDTLDGGAGTDTLIGGVGADILDGGRFDRAVDVLYGGAGNDTYLFGFADGRTLVYDDDGSADRVVFRTGVTPGDVHFKRDDTGSNLIVVATLNGIDLGDALIISNWYGGNTVESFAFASGQTLTASSIEAETGGSIDGTEPVAGNGVILAATDQADVSLGGSDDDEVYLLAGDDSFAGGSGHDRVFGGTGDDALQGNDGNDLIAGEGDDDQLYGQAGSDSLYGGPGNDTLGGGAGADSLFGGPGADTLLGGLDNDRYFFRRGDGDDVIRDDGGTADRIIFGSGIAPDDVTVGANGSTVIFDVRTNRALVGDRLNIADGFLTTTTIETIEFADGTVWNTAAVAERLPDAYPLDDGVVITGGANVTVYTLAKQQDDGFTIDITDTGGIDTIDLRTAVSGSGSLTPLLNGTSRRDDDLLLDVTIASTIGSIPSASGTIRINDFYSAAGFVETVRIGAQTMNAANAAPLIVNPLSDQVIALALPYHFSVPGDTFADSAFDRLTLDARLADGGVLPDWLTFNAVTADFSGTPVAGDAGLLDVAVIATDAAGLAAAANFQLNVGDVNIAPALRVPVSGLTALEGSAFTLTLAPDTFIDTNLADTLTFSAHRAGGDPLPAWLTFNEQTHTFSGMPATSDVEPLLIEVAVTDRGGLGASDIFTLNVDYLNDSPRLALVPADVAVTENVAFSFTLPGNTFTDSDARHGDRLGFALSMQNGEPLPGWLLFDATTLTFSGRPVGVVADQDIGLRLTAADNDGATAVANFALKVADAAGVDGWYIPHSVTDVGAAAYSRGGSVVAALRNGDYVVAWESAGRDGDARGIYAQRYRAAGTAVGATVRVNTTTSGEQRDLALAALGDGGFVVSWVSLHEDDGNQVPPLHDGGGIYAQLFAADASRVGSETRVNHVWSGIQNQPGIAALSDGGYLITWFSQFSEQRVNVVEYGIGEPGLFGQRYSGLGAPVSPAVRLADVGISDIEPSVAGLLGGGFVLTWTATDSDGAGIVAQRYDSGGIKSGPQIQVNSWAADEQSDPQVAALATGGFVIVWRSEGQDASGGGVYGQRFSPAGVPTGNAFQINTTTTGTQGDPAVSATPDGGFVVNWLSAPISGIGDLYLQRYGADGTRRGSETLVDAAGFQHDSPALAGLADGSIVQTWTAGDGGGVSTAPDEPWFLAGPTRIESQRTELRANAPVSVRQAVVGIAAAEFKSVAYRVLDNVFFDPDLAYGDVLEISVREVHGNGLPPWLAFDPATATFSGLPLAGDSGSWDIGVSATDRSGTVAEASLTITVAAAADVAVTAAPTGYRVNTTEPLENHNPAAVRLLGGGRVVVWDSGTAIYGQRYATDGTTLGAEFRLDSGTADSARAAIAPLDDGGFVAAWARADGTVAGRRYDSSGAPGGSEFLLSEGPSGAVSGVRVTQLDSGGFAVASMRRVTGSTATISLQRYSAAATPVATGAPVTITTAASPEADFALATLASGAVAALWTELDDAGRQSVLARRFNAAGTPDGAIIPVDGNPALDHRDPAITALASGGFVVTWTADPRDGDEDIFARVFEPDGSPRGVAWRVNNVTELPQRKASVTATGDGGFVIAWHSEPGIYPGEYGTVRAQYYDGAGNPVRDEFPVTLESYERLSRPAIVSGFDGGFDIYWESDHDTSGAATDAILARHFHVGGTASNAAPVLVVPNVDQATPEGTDYSFFVPRTTFTEPDSERLTYRATLAGGAALPGWLSFDPAALHLSGRPVNDDVGDYDIAITVTDPGGSAVADTFRLTVTNVNDAPSAVADIAGLRLDTGSKTITLDVLANDLDPDAGDTPANFSLDSVTLAGGSGSATVAGNKLHFDAGLDFDHLGANEIAEVNVTYTMSDSSGASAVGRATIALHTGSVQVLGGGVASVTSPAALYGHGTFIFGPGSSGSSVTFAGGGGAGEGGFSASARSTVQITPGSGTTSIGQALGDGLPGTGTVRFVGLSRGELKLGLGSLRLTFAESDVALHIDGFDPDDVFGGTRTVDTFVFDGIAVDYESLLRQGFDIAGTAAAESLAGTNVVDRISGFDGNDNIAGGDGDDVLSGGAGADVLNGGSGDDTYLFGPGDGHDVVVDSRGVDRVVFAAGLSSAEAVSVRDGDDLRLMLTATDSITFRNWYTDPARRIETVAFTEDNLRIVDSATVATIDQEHAPTVARPLRDQSATAGAAFSFQVPQATFTDVDLDNALTLAATQTDGSALPAWLAFDPARKRLHGTPSAGDAGIVSLRIIATDSTGLAVNEDFDVAITVPAGNGAPVVASALPDRTVKARSEIRFTIAADTFTDPDPGDTLSLVARLDNGAVLPSWLRFDVATRTFSGTAPARPTDITVEITARDGAGLSIADSFTVSITPPYRTIRGSRRADTLDGTAGADRILGRDGDDVIRGRGGNDKLYGGAGDDNILSGAGDDTIHGGSDTDTIDAGDGANTVYGGRGGDVVTAGRGDDWIDGGGGDDVIRPGAGDDVVFGRGGSDVIIAVDGDNKIQGGANADTITTGAGDDTIYGDAHNDVVEAGSGDDTLYGGSGDDLLFAGPGDDWVRGGGGSDSIHGGPGNDILLGHAGADTYFFGRHDGADTVVERNSNPGDMISFGPNIGTGQLWFSESGDDLRIDLLGTPDTVVVQDWFRRRTTVERFEVADGTYLLDSAVEQLVEAMAVFNPPSGTDTSLPDPVAQFVDPVIAAAWQSAA